jgi:ectoine hydroxylase-related dioxygenase (phytanoyl-CoA dioxygenase family)
MNATEIDLDRSCQEIVTRGFTIGRNILDAAQIVELTSELERAISEDLALAAQRPNQTPYMVLNLMLRGKAFVKLLENVTLHRYFARLLGPTSIVYAYTSSSMPPAGTNYSRRIHVDCPRFIEDYISNVGVTLALTDFTSENGATRLLPGSHRIEDKPDEERFERDAEELHPRAGDAIIFNARTWHRGGINRSAGIRHSVTMNVCRSYMRQQFDFPRMVDERVIGQLGPVGLRFLGFDVRMPVSLDEYYLPPDERPYKPDQG